jgi:hypothetical protein
VSFGVSLKDIPREVGFRGNLDNGTTPVTTATINRKGVVVIAMPRGCEGYTVRVLYSVGLLQYTHIDS